MGADVFFFFSSFPPPFPKTIFARWSASRERSGDVPGRGCDNRRTSEVGLSISNRLLLAVSAVGVSCRKARSTSLPFRDCVNPMKTSAFLHTQTWKGVVIDPEPTEDEAFAREVSMTWGEVCDVEVSGNVLEKDALGTTRTGACP